MLSVMTQKAYKDYFKTTIDQAGKERAPLSDYLNAQFHQLDQLTTVLSQETFWKVFPKILGIDAKLALLMELIPYEEFSNDEIIRMTETDYKNYFKELCGYDLKTKTKPSLIFTVM